MFLENNNFMLAIFLLLLLGLLTNSIEYLLKKKCHPNELYLEEVLNFKSINKLKVLNRVNWILISIAIFSPFKTESFFIFLLVSLIVEFFRTKFSIEHLNSKDESEDTVFFLRHKLVLHSLILLLLAGGAYFFLLVA